MEIIQIVPRLPPAIDGVGDYAFLLAEQLRGVHGIQTQFIVCDPEWKNAETLKAEILKPEAEKSDASVSEFHLSVFFYDGFPVFQLKERNAAELLRVFNQSGMPSTVLLHYVGYGYQKRGCPVWLVRALRAWKCAAGPRLVTVFHELYASGPPTRSVFYLGLLQRWITRTLHRQSAVSITSTVCTERLLARVGKGTVIRQPIPSNMPESVVPHRNRSSAGRWTVLIFGQAGTRLQTLNRHRSLLKELERQNLLEHLVLVGPGAREGSPDAILAQSVVNQDRLDLCGEIPAQSVADKFGEADFALSSYPAELACKSGSFMAALANGCPVILGDEVRSKPLLPGTHFLSCNGTQAGIQRLIASIRSGALDQVSSASQEWYEASASWPVAGDRFARELNQK